MTSQLLVMAVTERVEAIQTYINSKIKYVKLIFEIVYCHDIETRVTVTFPHCTYHCSRALCIAVQYSSALYITVQSNFVPQYSAQLSTILHYTVR